MPSILQRLLFVTFSLALATVAHAQNQPEAASVATFEVGKGCFLLNGEPFVVKAAELHYPRIPRPYWEQRIQLCKALGMNTICLYVFWNAHEQRPGDFSFEEQLDLA
ncbi:MAG: beta-galactosidase, partial [Bacteroidales bacterium]|nr:beta-galactosidase [Bacteroidales bacterium]